MSGILRQNEGMPPLIQVRGLPDHLYRLLSRQAAEERRSLSQQVIAVLARGLHAELDPKARRRRAIETIRASWRPKLKLGSPAMLIADDRCR
jgi:plasmid stability protein